MAHRPDIVNASIILTTQTLSAQRDAEMEISMRHKTATPDVVNKMSSGLSGATGYAM